MKRLCYLLSKFPTLSTTFIQHQVRATQKLGLNAILIATRHPTKGGYHPKDKHFLQNTLYLNQTSLWSYFKANLKVFTGDPKRYLKAIQLVFNLKDDFPWQRVRNLIHLAGAAFLSDYLTEEGVIHVHVHFAFGAAGVAIFLGALTDITYSVSIHGSDVLLPNPLTEEKLKRARFVVSNCRFHINNLRHRFPSLLEQHFYLIFGGVDMRSELWGRFKSLNIDGPLRLLNVARLDPVKAHHILIRACAKLGQEGINFHCRIVGDGPMKRDLENLIIELDLDDNIELMGSRYQDEIHQLYEWSQVVVLSSLSEGTPMTVVEAMAKARPVIAPNITGLPEMVIDGKTGFLFEKGSYEDLAERIIRLFEKPELMEQMGREGRKRAVQVFDLENNSKKLLTVFGQELSMLELNYSDEIEHE